MASKTSKPVRPIIDASSGRRDSPQVRFDAYLQDVMQSSNRGGSSPPTIADTVTDIIRTRTGTTATNTLNKKSLFLVEELLYPGDRTGTPIGQYVYVFSYKYGDLLVEALCGEEGWDQGVTKENAKVEWFYRLRDYDPVGDPTLEKPLTPKTEGVHRATTLLPVPGLAPDEKIAFFLSPVQLPPAARKIIIDNLGSADRLPHGCAVRPIWGASRGYVAIPEPTKWVETAHEKWFIPKLDEIQAWQVDQDQDIFVASVLETWRKPMNLNGELYTRGNVRKNAKKKKEKELQKKTAILDIASTYCNNIIDTHEHRAIEAACGESPSSMIWMVSHWSRVLRGAVVTTQGRQFVYQLARGIGFGKERLPYRLIAKDDWPSRFTFAENRYLAIAIHDAAAVILPYTKVVGRPNAGFIKRITGLLGAAVDPDLPPPFSADLQMSRPQHWRNRADEIGGKAAAPFFVITEIVNLAKSFTQWKQANKLGDADWIEDIKLIGSGADLTSALWGAVEPWLKKPQNALQRLSGAFMIAGAIGDVAEFSGKAGKAAGEEDWSVMAGASMAGVGATINAVAGISFLTLSGSFALFVAAPYLLAIGGVLMLLGSLIAAAKDSPYEEFAERSRFGNKYPPRICTVKGASHRHDHGVLHREWAHEPLGTSDREKEVDTLVGMMCAFSIAAYADETINSLRILPGHFPPESVFEIRLDLKNGRKDSFTVTPDDYNREPFLELDRDKQGTIRSINIAAEEFDSARVRLVVDPGKFQIPAPIGKWLRVGVGWRNPEKVNSFQVEHYVR